MNKSQTNLVFVDDTQSFTQMAKEFIEDVDAGVKVNTFNNPEKALDYIRNNKTEVDAVMCDYKMPSMDGLDFYQEILEEDMDVPFFIITRRGDETVAKAALELGVTDYIVKQDSPEYYTTLAYRIEKEVNRQRYESVEDDKKEMYDMVAKKSPLPIALIDTKTNEIIHINDEMAELLGAKRRKQIIGQESDSIMSINDDKGNDYEYQYVTYDGSIKKVGGESVDKQLSIMKFKYKDTEIERVIVL